MVAIRTFKNRWHRIMKRIGMEDRYAESGKPDELYDKYGLSAKHVTEKVKKFVKDKK